MAPGERSQYDSHHSDSSRRRAEELRVLIVDDIPVTRLGLRTLISREPGLEVCGEAWDVSSALELIRLRRPHLVLVDLSIQGASGLDLVKQVASGSVAPALLVISQRDELMFAERAIRAGASGFVSKYEDTGEILSAIHLAIQGRSYVSRQMTEQMLQVVAGKELGRKEPPEAALSDRELEVFEQIGQGRATRDIAGRLGLSVKTVDTHRCHIKRKLGMQSSSELMRRAVIWVYERERGEESRA
jgi:DNA-binding NarL/FixJ family response regulator